MDPNLVIQEATKSPVAGPVREDGMVPLYVIRPGIGRGRGRHLYEADMLEKNAGVFKGWKMFVDHQSPEAKKAAGGLPRSIRDLGGIIKESWWDPKVPADPAKGHGEGAIVGLARPTRLIRALIEDDPALVEASISATATGVRPVQRGGQTVWLVEGFSPKGSVDWVTEAGAGGKIASLMESLEESAFDDEIALLFEDNSDEEIGSYIRSHRPHLLDKPDGESLTHRKAEEHVDPNEIAEALKSDEVKTVLSETIAEAVAELDVTPAVQEAFDKIVAPRLSALIEAALEDERELIQAEANASAGRKLQVRDLREEAHALIDESKLPEAFRGELKKKYDLVEGEPTAELNVVDEQDEEGKVTKTASEKLRESVEQDIETARTLAASVNPTRVSAPAAPKVDADGKVEEAKSTGSSLTDHLLQESNFSAEDLKEMYEGI